DGIRDWSVTGVQTCALPIFRGPVLRRQGVLDAVGAALRRSDRDGDGKGVLLRPDVPRGEEQDAEAPDGVLDARARGRVRDARRQIGRASCREGEGGSVVARM